MLTGIDLLKIRSLSERIDFTSIETKYNIKIPPLYRVFNESFQWNTELVEEKEFYYYPELSGGEITLPFRGIDDSIKSVIGSSDDEVIDRKLLLVAANRFGFYVGTLNDDSDKIFTKTKSTEGAFKVVAKNIFEFLRGMTDNLSDSAETEEQYRQFMIAIGYEDDDLENEVADWKAYKGI